MQILPVNLYNNSYKNNTNTSVYGNRFIRPAMTKQPLSKDTVCFTGGQKLLESRAYGITHDLARQICREAMGVVPEFQNKLEKYFGPLVADKAHPDRPLASHRGIKVRIKTPASLCEKTSAMKLLNKSEVKEQVGDIIGARLVVRDPDKIDEVIKKLIEAVKANDIKIFEIENYAPDKKYSYLTQKQLDELEKVCSKMRTNGVTRTEKSIPSGYTATHFSVYLPDGFKGEIQLIGMDVEQIKEVEDIFYKLKNNKGLAPQYKAIKEALKDLATNKDAQKAVTAHSKEQYIYAREKENHLIKPQKHSERFLPAPEYLSSKYDFNTVYKMMEQCNYDMAKSLH